MFFHQHPRRKRLPRWRRLKDQSTMSPFLNFSICVTGVHINGVQSDKSNTRPGP
jgi:hypothetical protein